MEPDKSKFNRDFYICYTKPAFENSLGTFEELSYECSITDNPSSLVWNIDDVARIFVFNPVEKTSDEVSHEVANQCLDEMIRSGAMPDDYIPAFVTDHIIDARERLEAAYSAQNKDKPLTYRDVC